MALLSLTYDWMPEGTFVLRKEVIHPHLPVGIPCYDFTPVTNPTLAGGPLSVSLTVFW